VQEVKVQSKPNIVFLLVDDLGWGDLGCYGATFNDTPNIDRLASEGMLFSNAYAASSVCSPSRAAIMTGRYPARTHLTDWIKGFERPFAKLAIPKWKMKMDHNRILLPEALKMGGYTTAFFGKWHLMPEGQEDFNKHYPTNHGFDINIGGREWGKPAGRNGYFSPFDLPNLDNGTEGDYLTNKLTDAALDFLDKTDKEKPFLLYFSYYTVHGPIMSPKPLVDKYKEKAKAFDNENDEYINPSRAGMLESLDNSVGRVMAKLQQMGIAENTIIILTGDNGGNFDKTTGGLRKFKGFPYEGGIREPLMVKWPGKTMEGSVSNVVVTGTDYYPTILEMVGLESRPEEHLDGVSIAPILTGKTKTIQRDEVYWHYPHYHRSKPYGAIRKGEWKLIEYFEDGKLELYNLNQDVNETTDLSKTNPKKTEELAQRLHDWRKEVDAQIPTENPNYNQKKANDSK
tara:strand:- start:47823 stop:49190 length:1368 start_codon:yes stop_codon:yes gene_type:complete